MAKVKRKVKRKVRVKQRVELVHKNDKTRVKRARDIDSIPIAPARVYPENGAHFKVKLRKK